MLSDKRLIYMLSQDGFDYYKYRPTFGKWLYENFEPVKPQRWVRYLLEYLAQGSYVVYYMTKENQVLGYCLVAPGGRRLKCSTPQDVVLGPYYVLPEFRGNGYSKTLISTVIGDLHSYSGMAYDYIAKTNLASIRATEACGFTKCGELNIDKIFRRLQAVADGDYIVYRK